MPPCNENSSKVAEDGHAVQVAQLPVWAFCVMVLFSVLPLVYGVIMAIHLTVERREAFKVFRPPLHKTGIQGWLQGAEGFSSTIQPYQK